MIHKFNENDGKSKQEILEISGLNWSAEKRPLYDEFGNVCSNDFFRVVRSDNAHTLGVVKKRYETFQNDELLEFADTLTNEGLGHIVSAGSFKEGAKVFFNIGVPNGNQTDDGYKDYLMFSSSHNGSLGIEGTAHRVRIVCENTFNSALRNYQNKFKLRHTRNFRDKLIQAKEVLESSLIYFRKTDEIFKHMKEIPFNEKQLHELIGNVYNFDNKVPEHMTIEQFMNSESGNDITTRQKNITEEIIELSYTGKGTELPNVKGTAYGAYNAITEYLDHYSTNRVHEGRNIEEVKQESIYDGAIASKAQIAFNSILDMTGLVALTV